MTVLALETSSKAVSAAVLSEDRLLSCSYQDTGLTHSASLMPLIQSMLCNAGLSMADISAIAVAAGPGSFTGIRIGVSVAKGLSFAAGLPAVGVSTLEAMAWNVSGWDGLAVCAMDARRGQVYNAVFDVSGSAPERLTPDRAIAALDLAEELRSDSRRILLLGDGAYLCRQAWEHLGRSYECVPPHLRYQNAAGVALAAAAILDAGGGGDAQSLAPLYLRPPYALTLQEQQKKKEGAL